MCILIAEKQSSEKVAGQVAEFLIVDKHRPGCYHIYLYSVAFGCGRKAGAARRRKVKLMKICVYGAASNEIDQNYINIVEDLCEKLAKRGHSLVFGAGNGGLMGAAARGFHKGGGEVTGVVPVFFQNEDIEPLYAECTKILSTPDMGTRKTIMEDLADAFVVAPGGIGTFDEFFQVLTLKQLRQHNKPIALFNINGYYYSVQALMHNSTEEKFLREDCLTLYECFSENQTDELITYIEAPPVSVEEKSVKDLKYS